MPVESYVAKARLFELPLVAVYPCHINDANDLVVRWGHDLGAVHRPFHQEGFVLEVGGQPVSVATSGSTAGESAWTYDRHEVVELTRLCSCPGYNWVTRLMIRAWREIGAPLWPSWPIKAAVSYSQNAKHAGNIYRTDGWAKVADDVGGGNGGGTWSTKRGPDHPANGMKSLWVWEYSKKEVQAV